MRLRRGIPILESATGPHGFNFDIRVEPIASVELADLSAPLPLVARPWCDVLASARDALSPTKSSAHPVTSRRRGRAAFDCLWAVAVWSLFGLAICRLAAIQFARDDAGSFRQATQFGVSRWSRAVASPLILEDSLIGQRIGAWKVLRILGTKHKEHKETKGRNAASAVQGFLFLSDFFVVFVPWW